jgi:hypothetical protein
MPFNAYPIVAGILAMGYRSETDVYVSSDIAAGILDAAPHGARFRDRDDIQGDPYRLGPLVVTFRHDVTLPFRTLAITRFGQLEQCSLAYVLALGI